LPAWLFLCDSKAIDPSAPAWLLQVGESGEVVAETSRRALP